MYWQYIYYFAYEDRSKKNNDKTSNITLILMNFTRLSVTAAAAAATSSYYYSSFI